MFHVDVGNNKGKRRSHSCTLCSLIEDSFKGEEVGGKENVDEIEGLKGN